MFKARAADCVPKNPLAFKVTDKDWTAKGIMYFSPKLSNVSKNFGVSKSLCHHYNIA